jgi:hypothetical protein
MSVGRVFFAWVASGETFDAQVHAREDEQVFDLTISEREGEFATATLTVQNPRIGLLAPARKQRVFISAEIDGQVRLLFSGRVVGVPANITGEVIELEFIARPDNHAAVLSTFISQLKTMPQFHPALVSTEQQNDPTAVLEGFAGLLHWDRATGDLSLAPIAHDGTQFVAYVDGAFMEDSLDVSFSSAPIDRVIIDLDVSYTQQVPVFSQPWFKNPDGAYGGEWSETIFSGASGRIETLTPEDFVASWFSPGDSIDGGWTVAGAYLEVDGQERVTVTVPVSVAPPRDKTFTGSSYPIDFFAHQLRGNLVLQGMYEQPRRELVTIDVQANLQPVVEFGEPERMTLSAEGADIAPRTAFSISKSFRAPSASGDGYLTRVLSASIARAALTRPSLLTDLELAAPILTAATARAVARLAKAARCVTASFDMPFDQAVGLSVASVVRIADPRIPGGVMTGKVMSLDLELSGDGLCIARLEIGCSIGRAAIASTPAVVSVSGSAPFEPPVVTRCRTFGPDDGSYAVISERIRNGKSAQVQALLDADVAAEVSPYAAMGYRWAQTVDDEAALEALERVLQEVPTEIDAAFADLEPTDETEIQISAFLSGPVGILQDISME